MSDPVVRIDPRLPVCWEDPFTLRVGFETAHARVDRPSAASQRFVAALQSGVLTSQLRSTARRLGTPPREAKRVLDALEPALLQQHHGGSALSSPATIGLDPVPPPGGAALPVVRFCDGGRPSRAFDVFARSGLCVATTRPHHAQPCDVAVVVERFFEPLERPQRWLSRGVPHLLLRFTDEAVHVGPIVNETGAPCLACLALNSVGADPAIPALAAQLIGRTASAETPVSTELAAALALSLLQQWLRDRDAVHGVQLVFTVRDGVIASIPTMRTVTSNPGCTCQALSYTQSPLGVDGEAYIGEEP